jgi:cytoskeletal protein CcmA (bactofilin family)
MLRRFVNNERGSVIVLFALALTVLTGITGLVVDVGYLYGQHARLQNGVDAAVLAGAARLPNTASAASTAGDYAESNGLARASLVPAFSQNNQRIDLTYTETFPTFFLNVLGIDSASIKVRAAAALDAGGPFGFTIFSGSDTNLLPLNGSNLRVDGSMHSDQNLRINGSSITVTGNAEAHDTITVNGFGITIGGTRTEGAARIDMPDYTAQIQAIAATTYSTSQTFNGTSLNVDGSMYVDGSVTFNGNNISGTGSVLATGNITNNGNAITHTGEGQMFLYSSNGNITINGNNITIDAILYAPNGNITINGNNITINGRCIGNTVTLNGSGLTVNGDSNPVTSLPVSPRLVE